MTTSHLGGPADGAGRAPVHDIRCTCLSCGSTVDIGPTGVHLACGRAWDDHRWYAQNIPLSYPTCPVAA